MHTDVINIHISVADALNLADAWCSMHAYSTRFLIKEFHVLGDSKLSCYSCMSQI